MGSITKKRNPVTTGDKSLASTSSGAVGPLGFLNFNRANTNNIRAGLAGAFAQTHRTRLVILGDSDPCGQGSNGTQNTNVIAKSWPFQVGNILTERGYKTYTSYVTGSGSVLNTTPAQVAGFDARLTFSANIDLLNGYFAPGGPFFRFIGGVGQMDINFGRAFDTVDFWYPLNSSQGQITFAADGGAVQQTIDENNASQAYGYQSFTVNGAGILNIKRASGNPAYVIGVGVRKAAEPGIEIINGGYGGGYLSDLGATTDQGGGYFWGAVAAIPKLFETGNTALRKILLINGGYNDENNNQPIAQSQARLTNLILAGQAAGADVGYVAYAPLYDAPVSIARQNAMSDALIATATSLGAFVIDQRLIFESYAIESTYGIFQDTLHKHGPGHARLANTVVQGFLSA